EAGNILTHLSNAPASYSAVTLFSLEETMEIRKEIIRNGVSFGTALSICISWSIHKSVLWAIVHGFFSWLYVIYYLIFER
ncbi:MAG: hypothetical protein AAB209_06500, partial [Bacteroidota bacterium]